MKFDIAALEFESFKEFLLDNFVSSFSKSSFKVINILYDIESIYRRQNEIRQAAEYRESSSFIDDDNDFFNLFYSLTDKTKSFLENEIVSFSYCNTKHFSLNGLTEFASHGGKWSECDFNIIEPLSDYIHNPNLISLHPRGYIL